MDVKDKVEAVAVICFLQAMKLSPPDSGSFKMEMEVAVGEATLPLLIVGVTHKQFGDGYCFAILNPSREILEMARPDTYFEKYMVKGQCDFLSCQWVNINGVRPEVTGGFTYVSRKRMKEAPYAIAAVQA